MLAAVVAAERAEVTAKRCVWLVAHFGLLAHTLTPSWWPQYDAIVVGGGPAGSVISKLLSDDKWRKVLLIEAGDASQAELGGKVRSAANWC